jgi:hypothetical protein
VDGFPTIAGSTATDGSQTVRKLARVARTTESPLAEFNEDSKGRGRLAEFNGDSESPAARTNSIETAGDRRAEFELRTSRGQSSMETARRKRCFSTIAL